MRKFLLLLVLTVALAASAAQTPTAVRVQPTSGEAVTFLFDTEPELQLSANRFTVTSTAHPEGVTFEFDNVESIDFVAAPTSISEAEAPGITMTMDNGTLNFANVPDNSPVAVYTTDGRMVLNSTASGSCSIDLKAMASGIYIVRVAGFVTKVSF